MRSSTCAEFVRDLARVAEQDGDMVLAVNLRRVAELLDEHGCVSPAAAEADTRDTEPVKVLEGLCPGCGRDRSTW